jgi:hypothetical protein
VAVKGRAVAPPQPIRKGTEKCTIRLDMGDLVVTRTFHQKEGGAYTDNIKVENADGLRHNKPQEVLNALLGEIGFDPLEFMSLKPDQQTARLLEMVPLSIDLDDFRAADSSDYENRRDVNRDVARLKAQLEGFPVEEVPAKAPDRAALADRLGTAAETNAGIERARVARETERSVISADYERIKGWREEAARLIALADEQEEITRGRDAKLGDLPPLDEPVDTDSLRAQLRDAEAVLAAVDRQTRRAALVKELRDAETKSQGYTDAMAKRAEERNKALAEAEMPVPGLGVAINDKGDPVLTYEGLPFDKDQISTAVQLRVSTAIGMAANPRLRVMRISDGSLLDKNSMAALAEMAEAEDFQLWVEVVGDGGVGIIMENGLVRGADAPQTEAGEMAGHNPDGPVTSEPAKKPAKGKAAPKDGEKLL